MIISNLEKVITERERKEREKREKRERKEREKRDKRETRERQERDKRERERERVITEKLPITIIFFLKKKVLYVIIAKH